jgi:cardiolipin synthase
MFPRDGCALFEGSFMLYYPHWTSPAVQGLLGTLYIVLALLVTVDVLLKKSDVRSALGWIAAAWLSPLFGAVLYYLFGINRVTRRALRLRRRLSQDGAPAPAPPPAIDPALERMNRASAALTAPN